MWGEVARWVHFDLLLAHPFGLQRHNCGTMALGTSLESLRREGINTNLPVLQVVDRC